MNFANDLRRRMRLDVNAPFPARLFYATGDGEITFLGLVEGRDVIEFETHGGTFSVVVEDGDCWVYTIDGEDLSFSIPEAVTFTKLMERRARNPELEMMQYAMKANMRAMMEHQTRELELLLDRREAARKAPAEKPALKGARKPAAKEPESEGADGDDADADGDNGSGGAGASDSK